MSSSSSGGGSSGGSGRGRWVREDGESLLTLDEEFIPSDAERDFGMPTNLRRTPTGYFSVEKELNWLYNGRSRRSKLEGEIAYDMLRRRGTAHTTATLFQAFPLNESLALVLRSNFKEPDVTLELLRYKRHYASSFTLDSGKAGIAHVQAIAEQLRVGGHCHFLHLGSGIEDLRLEDKTAYAFSPALNGEKRTDHHSTAAVLVARYQSRGLSGVVPPSRSRISFVSLGGGSGSGSTTDRKRNQPQSKFSLSYVQQLTGRPPVTEGDLLRQYAAGVSSVWEKVKNAGKAYYGDNSSSNNNGLSNEMKQWVSMAGASLSVYPELVRTGGAAYSPLSRPLNSGPSLLAGSKLKLAAAVYVPSYHCLYRTHLRVCKEEGFQWYNRLEGTLGSGCNAFVAASIKGTSQGRNINTSVGCGISFGW
ncbi:hypothetical protein QOT17_021290 [Balamuthia mandrillaris]